VRRFLLSPTSLVLTISLALSGTDADATPPGSGRAIAAPPGAAVVLHEPIPEPEGLMAAPSSSPVFVYETGDGATELPASIQVGDQSLKAPAATLQGTGEDLLYRSAPAGTKPQPGTLQNLDGAYRPDRVTDREPWLTYHAVFDPDPIPFKRNNAKDRVLPDGTLSINDPTLQEIAVVGNSAGIGREVFFGSVLLELQPDIPVPLPSISPESRVLSFETIPRVDVAFSKDGADNYFVAMRGGEADGAPTRVRINFVMDAPSSWFEYTLSPAATVDDVPEELKPVLPRELRKPVERVLDAIGVSPADGYTAALQKLVYWFRDFETGKLGKSGGNVYLDLALGKKGVCRHRAYAFVITAQGFGIPSRFVSNEAHTFVESWVPGTGWIRIDLGGGAEGMNVRNAAEKSRHATNPARDPFGFPEAFRAAYSQQATSPEGAADPGSADGGPAPDGLRGLPAALPRAGRPGPARGGGRRRPVVPAAVRHVAPPEDPRETTHIDLQPVASRLYRGDPLRVVGHVAAESGPVAGAPVRISLIDPATNAIAHVLATTRTDPRGAFSAAVLIPTDADLGAWELVVEYEGDATRAPCTSD
jgi:hypothetical protein